MGVGATFPTSFPVDVARTSSNADDDDDDCGDEVDVGSAQSDMPSIACRPIFLDGANNNADLVAAPGVGGRMVGFTILWMGCRWGCLEFDVTKEVTARLLATAVQTTTRSTRSRTHSL